MRTLNKILIAVFTISIIHSIAFAQWVSAPSGTSNFLTSAVGISNATNYAAGFAGTFLKSTNSGQTWTTLTSPSASNINNISFPPTGTATTGWAASVSGLYKTTNGGVNWTQQISGTIFSDAAFNDLNTGLALTNQQDVRKTTDGGASFSAIAYTTNVSIHGQWLAPATPALVYLLGFDNTHDSSFVFKSTNGGTNWSLAFRTAGHYSSMHFINTTTGMMCGIGGLIRRTTDGGTTWSLINSGTPNDLQVIKYISTPIVYAVGVAGTIIKSTNAGLNWFQQTSNTTSNLRNITVFPSDDIGFTVGSNGTIIRTTNGGVTAVTQITGEVPQSYSLSQNYPNPFNPSTKLEFRIAAPGFVHLKIYDILGKEVSTIVNEQMQPGTYSVEFDAAQMPSGTYFYRLSSGEYAETKKMTLIK